MVTQIKLSDEMEAAYMRTEERERLIREKGQKIGEKKKEIQIICDNLKKGRSPEEIADFLCKDLKEIQDICRIAEAFAPEYHIENIYRELRLANITEEETFM
ncbi:MAG: hypothetical protein HFI29_01695 [Lachnospiraceae bacterium]|nr:hypothetical protein [Lachnospiraceae bacterium]